MTEPATVSVAARPAPFLMFPTPAARLAFVRSTLAAARLDGLPLAAAIVALLIDHGVCVTRETEPPVVARVDDVAVVRWTDPRTVLPVLGRCARRREVGALLVLGDVATVARLREVAAVNGVPTAGLVLAEPSSRPGVA